MPTLANRERAVRKLHAATRGSHIWRTLDSLPAGDRRKVYRAAAKASIQVEQGILGAAKRGELSWLFPEKRKRLSLAEQEKRLAQVIAATGVATTAFGVALRMSIIPALAPISAPLMLVSGILMGVGGFAAAVKTLELEVIAARTGKPRVAEGSILPTLDVLEFMTPGQLEEAMR